VIDLSIAIVSFNTRAVLERTLDAVLADTSGLAVEILVVDNASGDGSAAMVRERYPSVKLLANATNRFYTAANNQAMAASRGRYILILNSDARPERGTLPAMLACLDANQDVGALSPCMRFPDGRLQRNCARLRSYELFLLEYTPIGLLRWRRRRRAVADCWYDDWDRSTAREVEVVPGSCMMVRREVIDRVGGFDERLRLYFGEDDWCRRIRAAGFKVMYAAVGSVVHPEGASTVQVRRLARRLYFEDMVTYADKHFGSARARWLWALAQPTRWALDLSAALRR
jgi:GT2 family glycosyltransferase